MQLLLTWMFIPLSLHNLIEGDIDLLLEKFYQENQGHISSSLSASVNKPIAVNGTGTAVCTSK